MLCTEWSMGRRRMSPCSDTFGIVQKSVVSRFPAAQRGGGPDAWASAIPRGNAPRGPVGETRWLPLAEVGSPEMRPLPTALKAQARAEAAGGWGPHPGQAGPLQVGWRVVRRGQGANGWS